MTVIKNFNEEFVIIENLEDYLEAYIWLTTTPLKDIWRDKATKTYLSTVNNNVAEVKLYIPEVVYSPSSSNYFNCYTWLWKSLNTTLGVYYIYNHFKMNSYNEYTEPPIPKTLYEFYIKHKDLVDYKQ